MRRYYQLKFATQNGSITFSVPNAKDPAQMDFTTAVELIKMSDAVKAKSGNITDIVFIKYNEEVKTPIVFDDIPA